MHKGRVVFGAMDEVVFGRPAAEAIVEQMDRLGAKRAFLMVSGTLNRETDEIENIRNALGARCVGTFDAMPAHTPRAAVIAAADQARDAKADLIVTVGGGSITDGAKAVQLCLANDVSHRRGHRRTSGCAAARRRRSSHRPCGRSACPRRSPAASSAPSPASPTSARKVKEMLRHRADHPARGHPRSLADRAHAGMAVPLHRHPRRGSLRRRHLLARGASLCRRAGAEGAVDADARLAAGEGRSGDDIDARLDCQIGTWLSMAPLAGGRADGREPRHRLCAGRRVRRAARPYLLHDAAGGDALEQIGQCRAPGAGRRRDGPSGQGRRRRAGCLHPRRSACRAACATCRVGPEHFDAIAEQAMATPWVPRNPRKIDGPAQVREILDGGIEP